MPLDSEDPMVALAVAACKAAHRLNVQPTRVVVYTGTDTVAIQLPITFPFFLAAIEDSQQTPPAAPPRRRGSHDDG